MNIAAWIWLVVLSLLVVFLIYKDIMHTVVISYLVKKHESPIDDEGIDEAILEVKNSIKPDDSEEDVRKKVAKILKKHGVTADIEVAKITKKKSTNKKGKK